MGFDTEGTGLIPYGSPRYWGYYPARPFAFSFCDEDGREAWIRWPVDPRTRRVLPGPQREQEALRYFLGNKKYIKVGHNIAYDKRITEQAGFPWAGEIHDTMVMAHVATAGDELSYALKPLCKKYLNFPDDDEKKLEDQVKIARVQAKHNGYLIAGGKKEVERGDHVVFAGSKPVKADYWLVPTPQAVTDTPQDLVRDYGVGDAARTMLLFMFFWPHLEADKRLMATYRREMALWYVMRRMENRGTRVYPRQTDHLIEWYQHDMERQREIADANGGWIVNKKGERVRMNLNSSPQLMQKFYTERGYRMEYKERKKKNKETGEVDIKLTPTFGKDQLAAIGAVDDETGKPKDVLAKAILEYRSGKQTITAFLNIYKKFWYPEAPMRARDWKTFRRILRVEDENKISKISQADWLWLYRNAVWVLHPNYNQTGAVTGRMTCCIAEGTFVEIARDISIHPKGIPIEQVKVGDWAYCRSTTDGQLHLRQVKGVWNRGIAHSLVRVHWQSNTGGVKRTGYVDMTPEHRVATADGYVEAQHLRPRQRLQTMTRGLRAGRAQIQATGNRPVYEARFVLEEVTDRSGEMLHAHHRNLNKLDNHPSNLEWKDATRHWSDHSTGENNPRYIHWTKETLTELLERYRWSVTLAAKGEGCDYTCLRRHVSKFFDMTDVLKRRRALRGRIFGPPDNPYYTRNHTVVMVESLDHTVPVYDLWIDEHTNFFAGELNVKNSDPNLQQVASETTGLRKSDIAQRPRECFGPRPKCIWYLPDFSQIEVWMFAFISGEPTMQQLLLSGHDFHQGVADKSFVKRPDYEPRKKYYRKLAKLIMFGKLFGGGIGTEDKPGRMTGLLQMPFKETKEFIESFDEEFEQVKLFTKKIQRQVKRDGEAWNIFGRKYVMEVEWAYKVVNYLVQGTAADILKMATLRIDWLLETRWKHPGLGLLNSIHDELMIEVPMTVHSRKLMREIMWVMQMDSTLCGVPVPLPVGMKTTKRLYNMREHEWMQKWSDTTEDIPVRDDRVVAYWKRHGKIEDDEPGKTEKLDKFRCMLGGVPYLKHEQEEFADLARHMAACPYNQLIISPEEAVA